MVYPERKCDGIKYENSDGNMEGFYVVTFDDVTFGLCDSKMLGVVDFLK